MGLGTFDYLTQTKPSHSTYPLRYPATSATLGQALHDNTDMECSVLRTLSIMNILTPLEIQFGSVAELIAAAAALASTVLTIFALRIALAANATADKAQRETGEREQARDRRAVAGTLQAWWAVVDQTWGVVVANSGPTPAVFHDVQITVTGNALTTQPISIACLPPGLFFVESTAPWQFPTATTLEQTTAVTRSTKHDIQRIEFTDPIGTRWAWTAPDGLVEITKNPQELAATTW